MTNAKSEKSKIDQLCINTIRTLAMDAVQKANSGHPGTPMALAPVAFVLWDRFMRYNPANPDWPNRDRFVLSAGHASMLLYSALHILGYDISLDDIKNFRQLNSKCAGHPEYGLAPGVETTTGPLGQGVATSAGMAIAEKWLATCFNRPGHELINYKIFAVAGDGCMMEGISGEAASLAGHLRLNNLIWIYDNNRITIEGNTALAFSEDVAARFMAYNWNVQRVGDANDLEMLERAIRIAIDEPDRPSLIIVDSHIAYGAPNKQDTSGAHGEPLGEEEIRATKKNYGWDPDKKFHVPDEVKAYREQILIKGKKLEEEWNQKLAAYAKAYPDLAGQFTLIQNRKMPEGWDCCLPKFQADARGIAGRAASGEALNAIAEHIPWLMGGAADLAPSTKTLIKGAKSFEKDQYDGRNFHFGIREHAMSAILNGLSLSKIRAYGATFLVFSDYLRPALRLSALMEQPVIYIFTHDSIGVGEDGPTHQPIEHIASLRAIPNIDVIRPADANEVSMMWKHIMELKDRPTALILSRQALPTFDRTKYASAEGALRGAYVLADCKGTPGVILIGTGSEVQLCLGAHEQLQKEGIKSRVVSMPCWELYQRQDASYWEEVMPSSVRARVAVEAGSTFGWRRYTGRHDEGGILGMRDFGASAPIKDLLKEFGLTVEAVVEEAKAAIERIILKNTD
jgi:transketolase